MNTNPIENLDEYLATKSNAAKEKIVSELCELVSEAETGGAEVDEVDYDADGDFVVHMYADAVMVDNGIGAYEFWGRCCVDHHYEPELKNEDAFRIAYPEDMFAKFGLAVVAVDTGTVKWDDADMSGDDGCVGCNGYVTLTIADYEKFSTWATRIAA